MRTARPLSPVLGLVGALSTGCAQISAEAESVTHVAPGAEPVFTATNVAQTQLEIRWSQRGDALDLELLEHRACRSISRLPARREERIVRKPDAMIYWEYSLAALGLGLSALAFARPEYFATVTYNSEDGVYERDRKTGYRLGGVFAAVGGGFLIGAIVDTVRARDEVRVEATTVLREGPVGPCDAATVPASQRRVELTAGAMQLVGMTDLDGRVHFSLPVEPDPAPTGDGEPQIVPVALHVALDVVALPLVAPHTRAVHSGSVRTPPR